MKESYKILILFIIASILRLRFFFVSFLPFSTDSWPLIKNIQEIMQSGSLNSLPDTYDANWPASQIFSAILAQALNLDPILIAGIAFPLLGSFVVLVYYVFLRRIIGSNAAFIAALLLSFSGYNAFFSSSVTKETFSLTIFFIALFSFYLSLKDRRMIAIFALASLALLFSHHFTYLNLMLPIIFFTIAIVIKNITKEEKISKTITYSTIYLLLLGLIYYFFISNLKIYNIVSFNQIFIFASFQTFLLIIFIKLKIINSETVNFRGSFIVFIVILLSSYLSYRFNLLDATLLSNLWFETFFISCILILFLSFKGYKSMVGESKIFLLSFVTPFIAFYVYAVFAASFVDATTFSSRLLDFLLPASFPLAAIGLSQIKRKKMP
ncbi:MAG TPA: glycosyltransferase family 39 protein, partial [Geobacterales bacterium]|nr:glycosyltransferase family 39 protein [Geobacterales bacterium]